MFTRLGFMVLVLVPAALLGQSATPNPLKLAPRPTVPAITAADLMTRLYIFADDSMEGRESGTPGNLRGTAYIARELELLGLEPGGDGGTWFQDFPLEETRLDSATRVAIGDRTLAVGRDFLILPPLPQLGGVGGPFQAAGVPVVYGGKLGDPTLVAPEVAAGKLLLFQPADGPSGWQFWARFGPMQWQRYATANGIVITALDVVPDPVRAFLTGANISLPDTAARRGTVPVMYVSRAVAELMMGELTDDRPAGRNRGGDRDRHRRVRPGTGQGSRAQRGRDRPGDRPGPAVLVRRVRGPQRPRRRPAAPGGPRLPSGLQPDRAPRRGRRHGQAGDASPAGFGPCAARWLARPAPGQARLALGAADYFTKPIDFQRLHTVLEKFRQPAGKQTVLIVEDHADTREMLRRTLEKEGWAVTEAQNGKVGLQQLAATSPSLILLDLMMPEMDGFEFMDALRRDGQRPRVPVIVITAKDLTEEDRRRLNGGEERIIQKGATTPAEVLALIRATLPSHVGENI